MRIVETDWWTLQLPVEWEAEQDEDVVVIEDEDAISCIEISTLVREEGDVSEEDLGEFCRDLREEGLVGEEIRVADFSGLLFEHHDADFVWREWFVREGKHFLYIAYHCLPQHKGIDDAAVDEILSTLMLREE